jgi:hypothetical protein
MEFVPTDRGVPIREPSTANLLIDSIDRTEETNTLTYSSANFNITKKQSILNGFFTRLAVTEVVLDWCIPNVSEAAFGNGTLEYNYLGTDYVSPPLPPGNYTVDRLLGDLTAVLNAQAVSLGLPLTWSVTGDVPTNGYASLNIAGGSVSFGDNNLSSQLSLVVNVVSNLFAIRCPAILPLTYLDFVCDQLTYNQDLKDETTNFVARNTLYRWVFAWDVPPPVDALGYPIYQGYQPFRVRRYLAFPKQVRWEPNQPIGQLSFQVIGSDGEVVPVLLSQGDMEWNMCLQVSEV